MSAQTGIMRIAIHDRSAELRERLRDRLHDRLERASQLRCAEHGQPVVEVTIDGRENGWFDSRWITCCAALERQATSIVKDRC